MKQVTVIIPNYNGKKYLCDCLETLLKNTGIEIETIVVDNHSLDSSIEEAQNAYPEVKYLLLDKNYGFSKAVNKGIQASNTPYVLLLNNDTKVEKNFVDNLWQTIRSNKDIFSVEAKMLQYKNPEKIDSAGTFYNALGWAFARGRDSHFSRCEGRCETFAACGGAAIYRKSVFDEIGFFDENYFAYLEDVDIGYRARIYGYCNIYEPKAQVYHVGSGTSGSRYNEFKVRFSARNNVYLIYKNMPLLQMILNLPFLIIGFGAKIIFFSYKGLGKSYIKGLQEGMALCRQKEKLSYERKNMPYYIKIQLELWRNIARKRW